tara:strand:+ start:691 stop:1695 length:1005 start_codon:yes stop_codon:yes gene_type:complete
MLLNELIKEEEKNDKELYSSGPYWSYKNSRAIFQIKEKGLSSFRGTNAGIGTSFADNLVSDVRNELNLRGRLVGKIFSLPFISKLFNEQLRVTNDHIKNYLKNLEIVYKTNKNVLALLEKFNFVNTTDFGCVEKFTYSDKEYSTLYLEMADRVNKLSSSFKFKNIRNFFEIGGGFGANVHFLVTNYPNIKKIIYLDAVPNIYVGTEYLKYHFKDKVKDFLHLKDLDEISFSKDDELEILCIPPWLIEKLNVEIDHFHNSASFVEMPKKVIKNYIEFVKKFKTKEISLISYDSFNTQTSFNPEELNNFFENKLNISWKKSLIESYNKKLIYLTSK